MYSDDVQQNRLRNFRRILKSIGGTNEAARMMNKKNTYITHIAGPTPVRNTGKRLPTARQSFLFEMLAYR